MRVAAMYPTYDVITKKWLDMGAARGLDVILARPRSEPADRLSLTAVQMIGFHLGRFFGYIQSRFGSSAGC